MEHDRGTKKGGAFQSLSTRTAEANVQKIIWNFKK
jgi:hypothetical protein